MKYNMIKIIKKIVFSFGIIYGVNMLLKGVNIIIPMNIFSIGMTTVLGIPGLLSVLAILYLIK